jgi:hypothetical protein
MSTKEPMSVAFSVSGLLTTFAGLKLATGHGLNTWFAWAYAAAACWLVISSMAKTRTLPVESRAAVHRFVGSGLLLMGTALLLMSVNH